MTDRPEGEPPPDPQAYDQVRNRRARARGLPGPYIAGGHDPDPAAGLAEERRLGRLLGLTVAAVVLAGFVLGTVIAIAGTMR